MKDKDELVHKVIAAYNAVRDLIWVEDFEDARKVSQEIVRIHEINEYLKEEEKWLKILEGIKQELKKVPEEEREKIKDLMLKEKYLEIDANKVIIGSLLKEISQLREIVSSPNLLYFFEQKQKPVKKKTCTYIILEKTGREFEVRALIKKMPEKRSVKKLLERAKEWGYVASEPYIDAYSLSVELYSSGSYIEIRCVYPRLLIRLSFHKPPGSNVANNYAESILETLTQT